MAGQVERRAATPQLGLRAGRIAAYSANGFKYKANGYGQNANGMLGFRLAVIRWTYTYISWRAFPVCHAVRLALANIDNKLSIAAG